MAEGEEAGVGAPIIVTFTEDAPDRAAVEKLLVVESDILLGGKQSGEHILGR